MARRARWTGETTDELRVDIDSGSTGDKVDWPDSATAPLGTDDEAAGTPPSRERVELALRQELSPRPKVTMNVPHDSISSSSLHLRCCSSGSASWHSREARNTAHDGGASCRSTTAAVLVVAKSTSGLNSASSLAKGSLRVVAPPGQRGRCGRSYPPSSPGVVLQRGRFDAHPLASIVAQSAFVTDFLLRRRRAR
jgi:hypothetical protein